MHSAGYTDLLLLVTSLQLARHFSLCLEFPSRYSRFAQLGGMRPIGAVAFHSFGFGTNMVSAALGISIADSFGRRDVDAFFRTWRI
ncbi:MAG: hypothetical protein EBT13_11660 [Rhodobacteraceae bacterium]|nr:hypothetical protein [Paracoccaceae bacterium]